MKNKNWTLLAQLKLNVTNREMEVHRMLKAPNIRSGYYLWLLLVCFVVWQIESFLYLKHPVGKADLMQGYLWKELGQKHRKTNENLRRDSCLLSDFHLTKQRQVQQRAVWQSQAPGYQRTVFPWPTRGRLATPRQLAVLCNATTHSRPCGAARGVQARRSDINGGNRNTQCKFQRSKINVSNRQVVLSMPRNGQKKEQAFNTV